MQRSRDCNRNVSAKYQERDVTFAFQKTSLLLENRIPSSSGSGIMLVLLPKLSEDKSDL